MNTYVVKTLIKSLNKFFIDEIQGLYLYIIYTIYKYKPILFRSYK